MLSPLSTLFTFILAAEHYYIMYLEIFLWNTPDLNRLFRLKRDFAKQPEAKAFAGNQGFYNGILAAGLTWALITETAFNHQLAIFFSSSVLAAACYGTATVSVEILKFQGFPAALCLIVSFLKI